MDGKRIVFLNNSEDLTRDGVLQSQVLGQVQFIQSLGGKCLVMGFADDALAALKFTEHAYKRYGVSCRLFPSPPRGGVPLLSKYQFAAQMRAFFASDLKEFQPTHVYTRSLQAFGPGRKLAKEFNAVHVHGARGAVAAEMLLYPKWSRQRFYYPVCNFLEKRCLHRAERLSVVSEAMKSWVHDAFGRDDAIVIPCCIGGVPTQPEAAVRAEVRAQMGFTPEQRVLCYCGGTAVWQKLEEIVRLMAQVSATLPNARFLFICKKRAEVDRLAALTGLSQKTYQVTSGTQAEVGRLLLAADAGIILREPDLVNRVSCPVKVGEYLAAGLPLVMSPGIGDLSELVNRQGIGVLAGSAADAPAVTEFLRSDRLPELGAKCLDFARSYFLWDNYRDRITELFR